MTEETSDNPKDLFAALTKQMALMDSELHVQQVIDAVNLAL